MGSLKKILPVGVGLLLIILITIGVSVVKKANDRTPSFDNADKVYVSYDKYDVTYDHLYTLMKNQYGVTELLNMIDEQLYAEEISKVDVSSEEFKKFINKQVFGNEDLSEIDEDEAQDAWDEIISSLRVTGVLSKAQASDSAYDKEDSAVWTVVKDYYKLPYAREQWAKAEYLKKYQENREDGKLFDMTNKENSTSSIEKYYDDNYTGTVIGLFVPFSSEEAALQMMNKYGINILDKVLSSNDGWVSKDYDYYSKEKVEDSDMLTHAQVVEAFFKMYNDVYRYLNEGNDVITSSSYEYVLKEDLTAKSVVLALQEALDQDDFGMEISLPTTIVIKDQGEATVKWTVENTKYGNINDEGNKLVGDFTTTDDGELSIKLSFEVTYKEVTSKGNVTVDLTGVLNEETNEYESKADAVLSITVDEVEPFFTYELKDEFIENAGEYFKFSWTKEEATEINSTLATYLSVDSTKLKLEDDPSKLHNSYTIEPVKVGNYYYLILKLEDIKAPELFETDDDGEIVKNDDGEYVIINQELYDEIVAKKTEELLSDNAINEMIYERRQSHNVKIFDSYLEAVYEYDYKNFYETTLKLTDYDKYEQSKKNKKEVIVSYQSEAGNKKSVKEFTALDLFNRLEKKYASTSVATLVENYILLTDKELNNVYNPYTDEIYNETDYKNLMNSEISTLRKNFESDYFTYSYLSYYGFTPNFPAKYGWKKFIKDYFVAYSDQELLTVSTYGGTLYANALAAYIDSLYDYAAIKDAMEEDYNDWYSTTVINLLITLDYDYNADDSNTEASAGLILDESKHWENDVEDAEKSELAKKQIALTKELANLVFEVCNQTNAGKLIDQLNAVVLLYNDAAYEYDEAEWNEARANNTSIYDYNYFGKYKLAGLNMKVEKANTYDSTSSILEPFADACKELYKEAAELNLLDKTFDVPLLSKEAFYTDYGYHMIAVTSASSKKDLPSEEEIAIHQAQALVDAEQTAIDEAQKNIDTYKESGYNTSSYQAELEYHEGRKAHYESLLKEVLAKYGKEEDYKLDDDATAKITQWYTNVEKEFEEGTLVTRSYIKVLTENLSKFNFENSENVNRLTEFLEILEEQCDKEDAK